MAIASLPVRDGLDVLRAAERGKYTAVLRKHPRYGATNHGAGAVDLLVRQQARRVLDVGCGANQFVRSLRKRGVSALGVDFAHSGADIRAAAHALPFADGAFEWLTAFDVLEHLLPDEVDAVLAEFARVSHVGWIFSIAYRDSRIRGPGGATLHPTVRPEAWWIERLSRWIVVRRKRQYLWGRRE